MKKTKVTSVFILVLSFVLFFLIGYYTYSSHVHKINMIPVDYSDVVENSKKLEELYTRLNGLEMQYRFISSEKNREKYEEVRVMVDDVKREIDKHNSYGNMNISQKIALFFSVKNIFLIAAEFAVILWIVFIFLGIRKEMIVNRKKKLVSEVMFDAREDIDKFEKSAAKIRKQDNRKKKQSETYNGGFAKEHDFESDNVENVRSAPTRPKPETREESVQIFKQQLDKINDIVVSTETDVLTGSSRAQLASKQSSLEDFTSRNEAALNELQVVQTEEYQKALKEKQVLDKLKKTMNNPKVNIIVDYYKNGMDAQHISEVTNLSREEVDFVLRMLNKFMES